MPRRYIPIYIQEDATLHSLFVSGKCSVPDAVDTVVCAPDDGWRCHPKRVAQFPDINKLCNVASSWIYIGLYGVPSANFPATQKRSTALRVEFLGQNY